MADETPRLNLLTLRSRDLNRLRTFYESLGLRFVEEQHLDGPLHYSSRQGGIVFELYPTEKDQQDTSMPGFSVSSLEGTIAQVGANYVHREPFDTDEGRAAILRDPDGRLVYLLEDS